MSVKIEIANHKTQSAEAVKTLLSWKGRSSDPLPQFVEIGSVEVRCVLVLNNKRDAYYTVTVRACSCPSATYRPGQPCKHARKYFPQAETKKPVSAGKSIRPKLPAFKPISPLPGEEKARATPLYIDCGHDTTSLDVAYHSIKLDREMWPAEA
jgi:hypothetical protein